MGCSESKNVKGTKRTDAREPIREDPAKKPTVAEPPKCEPIPEPIAPKPDAAPPPASSTPQAPLKASERFALSNEVIGRGASACVYKGTDITNGNQVAIKVVEGEKRKIVELRAEFDALAKLKHPNIVRVFGYTSNGERNDVWAGRIALEYVGGGSLGKLLKSRNSPLTEADAVGYMRGALAGLVFLHSTNVLHRDIKPDNILIGDNGDAKLSDFGTCKWALSDGVCKTTVNVVGTVPYMSPESVRGKFSTGSDIWAIGCTMLHLLTKRMPWQELKPRDHFALLLRIGNGKPPHHAPAIPDTLSDNARDFIAQCFEFDLSLRPSALALSHHPLLM